MLLYVVCTVGEFVWNEGGFVPATCYLRLIPRCMIFSDFLTDNAIIKSIPPVLDFYPAFRGYLSAGEISTKCRIVRGNCVGVVVVVASWFYIFKYKTGLAKRNVSLY